MPEINSFFDTNVLLYLLSADERKAEISESLLADGGIISVQVLNEFASVATRKIEMPWTEIHDVLFLIRSLCRITPITMETHDKGLHIAEKYQFSIFYSMIVASALLADCKKLYTEDLQDGQRIEDRLVVENPFSHSAAK